MGFKYPVKAHATEGMMVQMFQNGTWKWTICCLMNCSKEGNACARGGKKSHATLRYC
jgi:hypothetical protein